MIKEWHDAKFETVIFNVEGRVNGPPRIIGRKYVERFYSMIIITICSTCPVWK